MIKKLVNKIYFRRNLQMVAFVCGLLIISNKEVQAQDSKGNSLPTAKSKPTKVPYSNMALTAKYVGVAVADTNWYNWCVSPIEGKDGKIHIFGSRWPAKEGMEGWTGPNAEVAHFVSDRPEGPFKYVATIMKSSMFPDPRNAEYNVRFADYQEGKMRHTDHRFEWTREEFEKWSTDLSVKYSYNVIFKPVGEVDAEVGALSQMAIFSRRDEIAEQLV